MKNVGLNTGDELHGFIVDQITDIPEQRATLYRLRHEGSGAELIHYENDDDNNLFSVAFRTTPKDSTGVAHILEHTVLCGSEFYPVRDPFFSMLKRSLNTFMNAFTASDWTMYPFSTQNEKDFYNLMDVYIDAAFFPIISEKSFMQEGWRLEFADPSNSESELVYKGIVYNEMKGAMSDPNSLMSRRLQKALYPSTTYHYNSGGEPNEIPDLTWQGLREFHSKCYHPSNSRFFTYGNLSLERHLKVIDERVLSRFKKISIDTSVEDELRLDVPRREEFTYPFDPAMAADSMAKKSMVSVAFLACNVRDSFEVFTLKILSTLLLGSPAAPLYKALMDSRIGSTLAPCTGYEDENRETFFSAGLQGIDPEDADKVEKLIYSTLERVASEGFSMERVEAVIHQVEFSNKEVVGNHFPYGLNVLFRIFGSWVHEGDPVEPLLINKHLDRFRKELEKPFFIEKKIREYMLDNSHRVTVILRPDSEKGARDALVESERLADIKRNLSNDEKDSLLQMACGLEKEQESEEDISCLPTLELNDIPSEEGCVNYDCSEEEEVPLQWFDQPTNGISYVNIVASISSVPHDLKPYVPLFCSVLTKIGAADYNYEEMAERIEAHTGGIRASANVWESLDDIDLYEGVVEISAKSLVSKHGKMFEIMTDIFTAPDFRDLKRLHMLIGQIKTSLENSVPASGHSYARGLAARHLTPVAKLRESWSGISQLLFIKELASFKEDALGDVAEKLESIASYLLNRSVIKGSVVTEENYFCSVKETMRPFLKTIEKKSHLPAKSISFNVRNECEGWSANVPVSYVAQVFKTVPYSHEDSAALQVLAKLLRSCYLHREIREKGGAYGGYAVFSGTEGLFSFLSYRDPHITRTIGVYNDSIGWVLKGEFSDEDLKEAILSTFADIDKPLSPSGKGNREFIASLRSLTRGMRQKRREDILALDRGSIKRVAEKYLKGATDKSSIAVISNEEKLNKTEGLKLDIYRI